MIAGIFVFLTLPLVIASVVYVLRRWASLSALLALGAALAMGLAIAFLPLNQPVQIGGRQIIIGEPVDILGRELMMEPSDRLAIAFLFFTTAGIFALGWRVAPHSLIFPIGLAVLSLLSGALLIRPLIYAALLIEIAAALSIFALQPEGSSPTRGGVRYLSFTMLALPGLLVTHWLMERYALTPDNTGLLDTTAILLMISFSLLLGGVPFHTWVSAIADDSEPLAGALILTVNNGAIWFLLFDFMETYSGLSGYPRFEAVVTIAGLAMVVVGGLLASARRRLLMGYGALVDTGATLLALGMRSELGLSLVLLSLLIRPFGLAMVAAGLSGLGILDKGPAPENEDSAPKRIDAFQDKFLSAGWEAPWSTAAFTIGGLTLSGLPPGASFAARWALCRALVSSGSPGAALLLLLAGMGVLVNVWRMLSVLLARPRTEAKLKAKSKTEMDNPLTSSEGWLTATVLLLMMILSVAVGIMPQILAPLANQLAQNLSVEW